MKDIISVERVEMKIIIVFIAIVAALFPRSTIGQGDYGQRVASNDGKFLLPVASRLLGSHESDHKSRGSVDAWDVSASVNTPVFPIANGIVEYAGCNNSGGYGCWLFINHGNVKAIYAHCVSGSIRVSHSQKITQWTQICNVGTTGMTSWPHVHLEIHRVGGGRYEIATLFDIRQMNYCKFCRATNQPGAQITGVSFAQRTSAQIDTQVSLSAIWLAVPFLILILLYLLSGYSQWSRFAIYHGMALYTCVVFFVMLGGTLPRLGIVRASDQASGGWEAAYKMTIGSEGWSCTEDGAHTMGGVTQGAYSAWRMSQGLGPADVCRSLTENQRKDIFVQRYWQASGADKMTSELALTHVDFAFNAGVGAAKSALAASGGIPRVYNDYRERFYLNARGCSLYCAGWLNRLNRIRKVTE